MQIAALSGHCCSPRTSTDNPLTSMSVILIGYRGSGKSSVGQHVARKLAWEFTDTDTIVTNASGISIKEIFEKHGEEHFRLLETTAIRSVMTWDDAVNALGGGAVTREENRKLIKKSGFHVIYL